MIGRLTLCCIALGVSTSACVQAGEASLASAGDDVAVTSSLGAPGPVPRPADIGGGAAVKPAATLALAGERGQIRALIARHAAERGVPVELADAVVRLESNYNPRARNGGNLGLTQISLASARAYGYGGGHEGLLDAETNLSFGIRYLAEAYRLAGGDTCGTVLRYQAGHRARSMTAAARRYCAKVRPLLAARAEENKQASR